MAGKDEQRPLHILFFPYPAPGHLIPIADMAALFATRGVKCTILTTPANAAIIRPAVDRANDARRRAPDALSPPAIQISVVPFPDVGLPPGVENATGLTGAADRHKFFHAIQLFREPFDRFFAGERPDAVVADSHFQWSVDAAAEHGVPRLAFLGTSMFARACTDSMMRNNPLESCPDAVVPLPGLPHRVEMLRGQMVDPLKRPEIWAFFQRVNAEDQRSYGEVFNSFHELEPDYVEHYRTTLGRRVWLVGPVAPAGGDMGASAVTKGGSSELSSDGAGCLRWLDTKPAGSVVYVSFGTLSSFTPAELRELARGLDLSGKNFVWVIIHAGGGADADADAQPEWMPEGFAELTAPPGGRGFIIRGWAPQTRILSHPALGAFLTHCGWNSTLEAVSAGVPMVTWPRFGDQFFNEKLVVEVLRIGASVGACDYASFLETHHGVVHAEVVAGSIGTVMGDGEEGEAIRSKARELGVKARKAVADAGSSYGDVGRLMEELVARRRNNVVGG